MNRLAVIKRVARIAKTGLPITQAVKLAGISHETYYNWVKEQPELLDIVENAHAETERIIVKTAVDRAIETKNVKDLILIAEHLYPDRYSPKSIQQIQGANGESVVFKVDATTGYIPPQNTLGLPTTLTTLKAPEKDTEPN